MEQERISTPSYLLALGAIVAVALVLRIYHFGAVPPGLYHDEAFNGLDALNVLRGARPLWFSANNGREPFFIYLVAASVALFGRTVVAVRVPALVLGTLTVPAAAFMGSSLFHRRIGLLTAAITAVTLWPVHLSRVGFRAVALPLFTALAIGLLWRGLRGGCLADYALAGLCYGATFYTYLAARFTPLPLMLLALLMLWPGARQPRGRPAGLAGFAALAAATLAPLALSMLQNPEILVGRASQVSIWSEAISHGDPLGTLVRHTGRALLAFFWRGDPIPRHNLPWRPIFEPALGLAFVAGLYLAARRRGAGWFVLLWVGAMLLPTVLAEDSPHFLRATGIMPVVFVLPALGLDAAWTWLAERRASAAGASVAVLALLVALSSTTDAYFRRYAALETVYFHFEAGSTELAQRINTFLSQGEPALQRAYISHRLWQDWPSLRFLVPESKGVEIIDAANPPSPAPAAAALLAVWPFEVYEPSLALLPAGLQLQARSDLLERGDRDPQPRQLALVVTGEPAAPVSVPLVRYAQGIELLEAAAEPTEPFRLHVRLVWRTTARLPANYTVFVQVLRSGEMLGQGDAPPADGRLPTSIWRPGDHIVDVHEVALRAPYDPATDTVVVGLYDLATMARLRVTYASLPTGDDAVSVPQPVAAPNWQ
ncbi:MAG: ArnT family glycosyltransferase [Anaerolineae bacterium]